MHTMNHTLMLILISTMLTSGCASSKSQVFGQDMPSMKAIHDSKFQRQDDAVLPRPERELLTQAPARNLVFQWLPNPTLTLYVFPHLNAAGHPIPGYSTFFKFYTQNHIAAPGEHSGWE